MPPGTRNVLEALFDIKPVKPTGVLDFEKIGLVKIELNLKRTLPQKMVELTVAEYPSGPMPLKTGVESKKEIVLKEFEETFSAPLNITAELASVGGRIHDLNPTRFKQRPVYRQNRIRISQTAEVAKGKISQITTGQKLKSSSAIEKFWRMPTIDNADNYVWPQAGLSAAKIPSPQSGSQASSDAGLIPVKRSRFRYGAPAREIEFWLERFGPRGTGRAGQAVNQKTKLLVVIPAASLMLVALLYWGGLNVKNRLITSGNQAVADLAEAKDQLAQFNFSQAADDFLSAYEKFSQVADTLNEFGAAFLSNFVSVPGIKKIKSAGNLTSVGKHIAKAGENLALAADTLSKTNPLTFLKPGLPPPGQSLAILVGDLKEVLVFADRNIKEADKLLANIVLADLPQDKQQAFIDFKEKIPQFQEYLGNAINYSDFLLQIIGAGGTKKYLVLLQNNSELRATGGFPGTYALVTFERGNLKEVFVDDIYNIDGQLKENIIPPRPLEHITPNWGMRDANWFADFPTSARKVEEFYRADGGGGVDGVLTVTPDIIARILKIVGPIELPDYGLALSWDNFLTEIQSEVEYGNNRVQPKTIVKNLQPKLFAKLAGQGKDQWLKVFKVLVEAVEQKHLLAYFNDPELEKTAAKNDLAGEIKTTPDDYLQIVFSNIKGSKTDYVIQNSFELTVGANGQTGQLPHQLKINRLHNGGDTKYGFYNRPNPAYVRVYLPVGSILESIEGHNLTDYRPLIGYEDYGFRKDPDLAASETSLRHPFSGVDVYEESGKTVFGFWLIVKPKEEKSVTLNYHTPGPAATDNYRLFWQKQSGTRADPINFRFAGKTVYTGDLLIDRILKPD